MKIVGGKVFIGHEFINGGVEFESTIQSAGSHVTASHVTGRGDYDAKGGYIIPGLIDIHTHGAIGEDAGDGSNEGIEKLSLYYAQKGITGWLPTTMTTDLDKLRNTLKVMGDFVSPANGARLLGIHLEGPFISHGKCGAQDAKYILPPDIAVFRQLHEASGEKIRLITLAPEVPGGASFIKEITAYCRVSLGHTAADYEKAMAAYEAGASHATHLYNGMTDLHHRMPGVVGAAFDSGATVELICDGYHVAPPVIRMTEKLFGERMILVSDSGRCADMPEGDYLLGGQTISLKEGKACLRGTDILACSAVNLMECVRRAVSFGLRPEDAVYAATTAPAAVIGAGNVGSIAPGKMADLVVLDEDLQVKAVFVGGCRIK